MPFPINSFIYKIHYTKVIPAATPYKAPSEPAIKRKKYYVMVVASSPAEAAQTFATEYGDIPVANVYSIIRCSQLYVEKELE